MMSVSEVGFWWRRLEKVAAAMTAIAMVACIGAPEQSYNATLALLLLVSASLRLPRLSAVLCCVVLFSFVCDLLLLSVRGRSWSHDGSWVFSFATAMLIINLLVKAIAIVSVVFLYGEVQESMRLGRARLSSGNGSGSGGEDHELSDGVSVSDASIHVLPDLPAPSYWPPVAHPADSYMHIRMVRKPGRDGEGEIELEGSENEEEHGLLEEGGGNGSAASTAQQQRQGRSNHHGAASAPQPPPEVAAVSFQIE